MNILYSLFIFLFGIIFGSFYNVIIYRIPLDMSIAKGRSFCPNCKTTLRARDLVPIFSQLFLGSKCRYCQQKISLRYPLVELISGLLFLLAFILFGLSWEFYLHIVLWSLLVITTLIDYDHYVICESILLVATLLALIYVIFSDASWLDHVLGLAVGFGFYLLIYVIARLIYKREAFGFGDVELMGSLGFFLGIANTAITCLLSFFVALFGIFIMKIAGKAFSAKEEIPFGPYICIAAFIASIFGDAIWTGYMSLF